MNPDQMKLIQKEVTQQVREREKDLAERIKAQEQLLIAKEREILRLKRNYSRRNNAQMQEIADSIQSELDKLCKELKLNLTQRNKLKDALIKILLSIGNF